MAESASDSSGGVSMVPEFLLGMRTGSAVLCSPGRYDYFTGTYHYLRGVDDINMHSCRCAPFACSEPPIVTRIYQSFQYIQVPTMSVESEIPLHFGEQRWTVFSIIPNLKNVRDSSSTERPVLPLQ